MVQDNLYKSSRKKKNSIEVISPLFQTPRVQYTGYKKASGWSTRMGEDNFLLFGKVFNLYYCLKKNKRGEVKNEEF